MELVEKTNVHDLEPKKIVLLPRVGLQRPACPILQRILGAGGAAYEM